MKNHLRCGDAAKILKSLPDNSVDSLVTDPPAGISFMCSDWDSDKGGRDEWIAWLSGIMKEALRVMKPGAHGLVWALPRTSHWTATALENAGFEVRDIFNHIFASGFPKSLNISKAIDRYNGCNGIDTGKKSRSIDCVERGYDKEYESAAENSGYGTDQKFGLGFQIIEPESEDAKKWAGFGTALKPAVEHWILVRKPIKESTIAKQVLATGTGGLNIDGCRVGTEEITTTYSKGKSYTGANGIYSKFGKKDDETHKGRFPANLILTCNCPDGYGESKVTGAIVKQINEQYKDNTYSLGLKSFINNTNYKDTTTAHLPGCPCYELDQQSGYNCGQQAVVTGNEPSHKKKNKIYGDYSMVDGKYASPKDKPGGASRFFYCPKCSTKERNMGLDDKPSKKVNDGRDTPIDNPFQRGETERKNTHPTVKPIKLMTYLIKLITPPGGVVLDPFAGSGSTLIAAKKAGFYYYGIEQQKEYVTIARARLKAKDTK